MIRTLYCTCCGAPRTFDTARPYRSGGPNPKLACLRCGTELFTTERSRAPIFPPDRVVFTVYDNRFLKALRIATA